MADGRRYVLRRHVSIIIGLQSKRAVDPLQLLVRQKPGPKDLLGLRIITGKLRILFRCRLHGLCRFCLHVFFQHHVPFRVHMDRSGRLIQLLRQLFTEGSQLFHGRFLKLKPGPFRKSLPVIIDTTVQCKHQTQRDDSLCQHRDGPPDRQPAYQNQQEPCQK